MFGRTRPQPAGAIDLTDHSARLGNAPEIMRVFVPIGDGEPVAGVFVDPFEGFTPFMFGILLADIVHHAAKAYAYKFGADEADALYEISQGLTAELRTPTDTVQQFKPEAKS